MTRLRIYWVITAGQLKELSDICLPAVWNIGLCIVNHINLIELGVLPITWLELHCESKWLTTLWYQWKATWNKHLNTEALQTIWKICCQPSISKNNLYYKNQVLWARMRTLVEEKSERDKKELAWPAMPKRYNIFKKELGWVWVLWLSSEKRSERGKKGGLAGNATPLSLDWFWK